MRSSHFNALIVAATFVFPGCTCSTTREVVHEPAPQPASTVVVAQPTPPPPAPPPPAPTTVINK